MSKHWVDLNRCMMRTYTDYDDDAKPDHILFDFCGHRYADEHCSSLGGSLVVPRNEIENLEVVDIAEDYYKVK